MRKEVKQLYASYGIDVNKALKELAKTKVSLHCWQLDDVHGFEESGDLTGGIQTTGNYPGRARNFEELTADLDKALTYIPGSKKINLHAIQSGSTFVSNGHTYGFCMACGTLVDLGTGFIIIGSLPEYPRTTNGSILLPNGVIVLVEGDLETYYDNALVFGIGEIE